MTGKSKKIAMGVETLMDQALLVVVLEVFQKYQLLHFDALFQPQ